MPAKDVLEPGSIVLLFTIGTLYNSPLLRRRLRRHAPPTLVVDPEEPTETSPLQPGKPGSVCTRQARIAGSLGSRFLAAFPFLFEILYWNLTYWTYQLARAFTALHIRDNKSVYDRAEEHAQAILTFEQRIGLAIEKPLQQWFLTRHPKALPVLALIYYSHITLTLLFLIYAYTTFPRPSYQSLRRTIASSNALAFAILSAYRTSPPRLMPPEAGYVDVLHPDPGAGSAWTNNRFQLTIAAMPSLHFGMALFVAYCLVRWSPHAIVRLLAPLWPIAMVVTVLGTANHWVLDVLVGGCVPLIAWRTNEVWLLLRPLEEGLCWLLGVEKPLAADVGPGEVDEEKEAERID
ncbi:hypothetical protein EJ06DRAFT_541740 [Trichodelitschia bisporula]|uniref:Inositolphosphotransferase Aur1/Ipt1 domain-containing protein n=1 Tax=Trichodelitschia bisporula TaxID=703511 RepID=A0A6G1I3N2_9PEZI|nr:hypothetical protein EJ06DRAFT_541740 [Trichodelitschia bisporula]